MTTSFVAALGALRSHQSWIDVIGNNLANSNTPGFKSSRALFSDLLSVTFRPGTGPGGTIGGVNPLQQGLGTQLASVDRQMNQGALDVTGRTFDLALLGQGFFALDDGSQTLYSRVGAFGLDGESNLVDLRSGYRVLGANGAGIEIDTTTVLPPSATTRLGFSGNLPATVTGPLSEVLTSSASFNEGTAATTTGLASGPFTLPVGETWSMEISVNGGAPQLVEIQGTGAPMSTASVVAAINAQIEDATATEVGGQIALTSDRSGTRSSIEVSPGSAGQDLQAFFGLQDFVQGTQTAATTGSDLNDLTVNLTDYQPGDVIQVAGTDTDGSPVMASFVYGTDGTTLGELVNFLDAEFDGATVAFDPVTGEISATADTSGEAELSLSLSDAAGQMGGSTWSTGFFAVTTNGTGPDTVTTSTEVFDASGVGHVVNFDYVRQDDGSWNMVASIPPSAGTIVNGTVAGITFNDDGSVLTPTSGQIELQFTGLPTQTVDVALGTSGNFDGVTQFGGATSLVADFQNGYSAGELASMQVLQDGSIEGFYTNGETQVLGTLGVATFTNEAGLAEVGDSYFRTSANSGTRILGQAAFGRAGEIVGGAIESSNVDTAVQFVHLIEAQRGFQANARVITVQDELLAEVVNVV